MEFHITGIRHRFPATLSIAERTEKAEELVKSIEIGTEVILRAEPDNEKDADAVAVYLNYIRRIGYISAEELGEVHQLLNNVGEATGRVSGNDGHITMTVEVDDKVGVVESSVVDDGVRKIAELPFGDRVFLPLRDEERGLQILEHRFLEMKVEEESAASLMGMVKNVETLLPETTLCREDVIFLRKAMNQIVVMLKLGYDDDEKAFLNKLRNEINDRISDLHSAETRKELFWKLMEKLREHSKSYLLPQYNKVYIAKASDPKTMRTEERKRLNDWVKGLPDGVTKRDGMINKHILSQAFAP